MPASAPCRCGCAAPVVRAVGVLFGIMVCSVVMMLFSAAPVGQAPSTQGAEAMPAEFQQWLEQLSSPRFARREQATEELCEIDREFLPAIHTAYVEADDYEVKRRLRYVAEAKFYQQQMEGRRGFLGIRVGQRVEMFPVDGSDKALRGVVIEEVLEGFSAQRSGLMNKDVIISVDGKDLPDDPTPATFIAQISAMPPGRELSVRVVRTQGLARGLDVPLGDEPGKALEGASFEVTPGGLRIQGVLPGSPAERAGLRANDHIARLNGRSLAGGTGLLVLNNILQTAAPGDQLTLELHDVRDVTVPVKLGARPVEMVQGPDVAEAQAKFMMWWVGQGGEYIQPAAPSRPRMMVFGAAQQVISKPPDPREAEVIP